MGLTKRKDSYYVEFSVLDDGKVLTLGQRSYGGRLKRWKVGCTNRTVAKQHEALIKAKLLAGTFPSEQLSQSAKTFAQFSAVYVNIEEVRQLRSYRERCQRIEQVLKPLFGQKLLKDITVRDVEHLREVRGENRALSTVNLDHSILKHMLKHAMKRDLVARNVATLVASPKPQNARDRVLSREEWERLYIAAPDWFKPVLLRGYHTGMRLEEILTLTWDRVDLEKNRIFLPIHLTKSKRERLIPLTPTLRQELHRLKIDDGVIRFQGLVYKKKGRKITHSYRVVKQLCVEQNIPNFVFHDLRHCAVTNLADAGVDTETIMKIVGHSSVEMFLRYRSIKPEKLDAAMRQLDARINTPETPAYTAGL